MLDADSLQVSDCDASDRKEPRTSQPAEFSAAARAAVIGVSALVAACGVQPGEAEYNAEDLKSAKPVSDEEAARFLQRAQFSSTKAEINALRSMGSFADWLSAEYAKPLEQTAVSWMDSRGYNVSDQHQYWNYDYYADFALWKQLFTGNDMMRRRMALALSEFFVASLSGATFGWRTYAYASWWDLLMRNAFGNFRTLLEEVTLHPAMGSYLNTAGNRKENAATGRVPDENYAREVMQLFSIGLLKLNPDGTPTKDGNGKPIESYTQDDVTNLARVFTGYEFDHDGERLAVPGAAYTVSSTTFARKPMRFVASQHSTLEARFLGTTIPAGTPGGTALRMAMDTLFNHPNVGPFFCRQMIQRLVTSNPSPGYVARVASVFNSDENGMRGNMQAVWAAILLDPEARSSSSLTDSSFGKLREPMLRFIQWGRTFKLNSAAGSWKISSLSNAATQLGQSPLRAPSVFNYFRPGYVPPGTALATVGATAPEFQIVNESTVGGYLNFMQDAIRKGIEVRNAAVPHNTDTNRTYDVTPDYTAELALVTDPTGLVDHLNLILAAGQLSTATRQIIVDALVATPVTAASSTDAKLNRVAAAVLMVMASAEYLVQK